jgi:hypothetical protein
MHLLEKRKASLRPIPGAAATALELDEGLALNAGATSPGT